MGGTDACAQCRRAPCRARPALLGFQFPQQGCAGRPLSRATGPREDLAPRPQSLPGLADIPGVGSNIWMRMLIRPPRRRQFGALEAGPSEQALKARADLPTASVTPLNDTHIQAPGPLSFIKKKKKNDIVPGGCSRRRRKGRGEGRAAICLVPPRPPRSSHLPARPHRHQCAVCGRWGTKKRLFGPRPGWGNNSPGEGLLPRGRRPGLGCATSAHSGALAVPRTSSSGRPPGHPSALASGRHWNVLPAHGGRARHISARQHVFRAGLAHPALPSPRRPFR